MSDTHYTIHYKLALLIPQVCMLFLGAIILLHQKRLDSEER